MADTAKPAESKLSRTKEIKLAAPVLALDATPDGTTLFAACLDGAVVKVDVQAGTTEEIGRHESYASGVALLPGGTTLVSSGYDGVLQWHDLTARRQIRKVTAHKFWSWDLAASPDGSLMASVTGQYQSGGYRYEPAPEREPSVRIHAADTGELRHSFPHVPPVQSVAFSPDSHHVAAGNLMGEVRVWDVRDGRQAAEWKTEDLTSWGVIKSHHYLGGVFAMQFSPDGEELYVCGMGPMVDPMAGNGVQRWQRFHWRDGKKLDQTHEGESGQGLMEAFAFHPGGGHFVMGGRLFQGTWNLALFEAATGKNLFSMDAKHRITGARFDADGRRLFLGKARHQERKDGRWLEAGLVEVYDVTV